MNDMKHVINPNPFVVHSVNASTMRSPLGIAWDIQPVRLWLKDVRAGQAIDVLLDERSIDYQYTGHHCSQRGAEVVILLNFEAGQKRTISWKTSATCSTDLKIIECALGKEMRIGPENTAILIPAPSPGDNGRCLAGPFSEIFNLPMQAEVFCEQPLENAIVSRVNTGPIFEDYELRYVFAQRRNYTIHFRFWKHESFVEVSEKFSLGMNANITWVLNPNHLFDSVLSRDSFEGESQPTLESLALPRVRDVLCRLQMPVLSEYFIPNNRGWFALIDNEDHSKKMFGIMGLYGPSWREPVANMPEIYSQNGTVQWRASLVSGERHFLLYQGDVESNHTPQRRLVFHRLHAQFNACRLEDHLDLTGTGYCENHCESSFFSQGDYHAAARERITKFPVLQKIPPGVSGLCLANFSFLVDPSPKNSDELYKLLTSRFEKWVRQFQGWRSGQGDYQKNVIGFSRYLRGMLLGFEMLRRDGVLTLDQLCTLQDYFIFAARRIMDQGRWPHSHTWQHPDHPESVRDFYTYGGEHKPDRLVWTNSLPNFQSDPLCALAHLGAVFKNHPAASNWRRFALDEIDRQLDAYCGASGAWEESINYALYTFSYFTITFRALKEHCGINYFQDERVRRFASWLVQFLGPCDKRWNLVTYPGIGNAICPSGNGEYLLVFAGQLELDDPLRAQLLWAWKQLEPSTQLFEHYPTVMAALAPLIEHDIPAIKPLGSQRMDEVGVAMRDKHLQSDESYLFEKIGFAKDHYEADESSFNWYAKGTPLCMDYGTYTGDVAVAAAHNLVEIPDADSIRRGYLKAHHFTPIVDYTHSEIPVTLKLLWGRVRSFEEIENKDGKIAREETPFFYIGDKNPVGPKVWKLRQLMFVKPDYVAIFDRVFGNVPHRYNLHVVGKELKIQGNLLHACGDFDHDLLGLIGHPQPDVMDHEIGRLVPNLQVAGKPQAAQLHAQSYWRLYNRADGIYRTLLFAKEKNRDVALTSLGTHGMLVQTAQYTDVVFINDEMMQEQVTNHAMIGDVRFVGRSGWIRRAASGQVQAMMIDGDCIEAFGKRFRGRGPWTFNMDLKHTIEILGGPPREILQQ